MNRFDRINAEDEDKPAAKPPKKLLPKVPVKPTPVPVPKPIEDFEERVEAEGYMSKLPWPSGPVRGRGSQKTMEQRNAYREDSGRLHAEFKRDLFAYFHVTQHRNVERAFEIAWSRGHADGHGAVMFAFAELVDLLD
jgi:hypothetical protein